jgi:hypothetical protein
MLAGRYTIRLESDSYLEEDIVAVGIQAVTGRLESHQDSEQDTVAVSITESYLQVAASVYYRT